MDHTTFHGRLMPADLICSAPVDIQGREIGFLRAFTEECIDPENNAWMRRILRFEAAFTDNRSKTFPVAAAWVAENFGPGYVDECLRNHKRSGFVTLPPGRSRKRKHREGDSSETLPAHETLPALAYQQGNKAWCLPYSFASVLKFLSFHRAANEIATLAKKMEGRSLDFCVEKVLKVMKKCLPWLNAQKFGRGELDPLNDMLEYPTLLVLEGDDGSTTHAVATACNLLFDSNLPNAQKITREWLDWCCSTDATRQEFACVFLAYRFVKDPSSKEEYACKKWY